MDFQGKTQAQADAEFNEKYKGDPVTSPESVVDIPAVTPEVAPIDASVFDTAPAQTAPVVGTPDDKMRGLTSSVWDTTPEEEGQAIADAAAQSARDSGSLGDQANAFLYRMSNDATFGASDHAWATALAINSGLIGEKRGYSEHLKDIRETAARLESENPAAANLGTAASGFVGLGAGKLAVKAGVKTLGKFLPMTSKVLELASPGTQAVVAKESSKWIKTGFDLAKSAAVTGAAVGTQNFMNSIGTDKNPYDALLEGTEVGAAAGAGVPATLMVLSKAYKAADKPIRKVLQAILGPRAEVLEEYGKRIVTDAAGNKVFAVDQVTPHTIDDLANAADFVLRRVNEQFEAGNIQKEARDAAYKEVTQLVKDTSYRIQQKLKDVRPDPELASKIHESINRFREKSWELRKEASEILDKSGVTFNPKDILDDIARIQSEIKGPGGIASTPAKATIDELDRIAGGVHELYTKTTGVAADGVRNVEYIPVTATQYESLIQAVNKSIDPAAWGQDAMRAQVGWRKVEEMTAKKNLRKSMRGRLKDADISGYEEKMSEVHEMLKMQDELRKVFPRASDESAVNRALMGLVRSEDQAKIRTLESFAKIHGGIDVMREIENVRRAKEILSDYRKIGRFHEAAHDLEKAQGNLLRVAQVLPKDDPEIVSMADQLVNLATSKSALDEATDNAVRFAEEMRPLYSGPKSTRPAWQESVKKVDGSDSSMIRGKIESAGRLSRPSEPNVAILSALERFQQANPLAGEPDISGIAAKAKDAAMDKYFRGKFPQGSARTIMGMAAGGITAHAIGGDAGYMLGAGSLLGMALDNYGGQTARKLYKAYLRGKIENFKSTSYLPLSISLAAGRFGMKIMNSSPEYREIMDSIVKNPAISVDKKIDALNKFRDGIDVGEMFGE